MPDYVPTREGELLAWSNNIATKLVADPTAYGLEAKDATDYQLVQQAFAAAYALATDPATRTPVNIRDKTEKKQALIAATRPLVQTLQNWSGMTNGKRKDLDIPLRDNEPTPIGIPTEMPVLRVTEVSQRVLDLELLNQENEKRKPNGVRSAWLYTHVGADPSPDLTQWKFEGESTRSNPQIVFPESVAPGTEVWVTALWVNPTGKPGPACAPVKSYTGHDGLSQAA